MLTTEVMMQKPDFPSPFPAVTTRLNLTLLLILALDTVLTASSDFLITTTTTNTKIVAAAGADFIVTNANKNVAVAVIAAENIAAAATVSTSIGLAGGREAPSGRKDEGATTVNDTLDAGRHI
ncbi:uncharacterized protein IWZ02DRAFT_503364 [Phyllosticta citriasiana]|uniref:uncharacterized protein n=1 Tax=Phyllosticta citriasiana TaxID=595635 RepID=UPI0030FD8ED2